MKFSELNDISGHAGQRAGVLGPGVANRLHGGPRVFPLNELPGRCRELPGELVAGRLGRTDVEPLTLLLQSAPLANGYAARTGRRVGKGLRMRGVDGAV